MPVAQPPPDPLLDCLDRIAQWHGVDFDRVEAVAGLPLEGGSISPALLIRAAQRGGLRVRLIKRSLKRIPASLLPAIVLLKDRRAGVLEPGIDDSSVEIFLPESSQVKGDPVRSAQVLKRDYAGYAILVHPATDNTPDEGERPEFNSIEARRSWFWRTVWRFRGHYAQLLPASLLINLFMVTTPFFVMIVYDRVVPNDALETLWVLAIGVGIVFSFDLLLRLLRGFMIERAGKDMDQVMASALFEQVLAVDMVARPSSGSKLAGKLKAYEVLRQFFMSASILALADLPFGLLMIGIVFFIGGPLGWILVLTATMAILIECLIQFPLRKAVAAASNSGVERSAFISEVIGGLESVKGARAEPALQGRLERMMSDASTQEVRSHWFGLLGNSVTTFLINFTSAAIIVGSVYQVYAGAMSMGAMIACVMLGARAMNPIAMVAGLMTRLQQSMASLKELNSVMNLPRETGDGRLFVHRQSFENRYQLKNVRVRYPGQAVPALDGVSLTFEPGDRIALLGRVGSGKTTLLRLLAKLCNPDEGEVLLDGIDLAQYHPATVRRHIGFLPQDATLFTGTLRDNIALCGGGLTDQEILLAANRAGLTEFINRHPKGLHAEVGERGVLLSGGQRQAVALARALVTEPRLLLLDEPSSAIDIQSERQILTALRDYLDEDPTRTLIVSCHKLNILEIVDRIVVLEQAQVVADGAKEAVLALLKESTASQNAQHSNQRSAAKK